MVSLISCVMDIEKWYNNVFISIEKNITYKVKIKLLRYIDKFKIHITTIAVDGLESIEHHNEDGYEPHLSDVIDHCYVLRTLVIDLGCIIDVHFSINDELTKCLRIMKLRNIKNIVGNKLTNRKMFTSKSFIQLMSNFSNLRHLEISDTSSLTCGNIFRIITNMAMLTHKNVEGTCSLCPKHVIKILEI